MWRHIECFWSGRDVSRAFNQPSVTSDMLSLRPPCHWSKKWKAALQSASGTKFRILMAAGMSSTLLKIILMLSCTLRTAELPFPLTFPSADHRISRPWTFQLWKASPKKGSGAQQSRFSSCNNAIWTCLPCFFFFCVSTDATNGQWPNKLHFRVS